MVNDFIAIVLNGAPPSSFFYARITEGIIAYEAAGASNMLKSIGRGVLNPSAGSGCAGGESDRPEFAVENSAGSSTGEND